MGIGVTEEKGIYILIWSSENIILTYCVNMTYKMEKCGYIQYIEIFLQSFENLLQNSPMVFSQKVER